MDQQFFSISNQDKKRKSLINESNDVTSDESREPSPEIDFMRKSMRSNNNPPKYPTVLLGTQYPDQSTRGRERELGEQISEGEALKHLKIENRSFVEVREPKLTLPKTLNRISDSNSSNENDDYDYQQVNAVLNELAKMREFRKNVKIANLDGNNKNSNII